ncbi:cobalamin biosynthesis protein [Dethiosulfovibrio salsuginis]|uniref:Cobalt-precorrin 5A hydrolase / precorrin-3B C17-methyltransferase n=1 Tax=Dethiosulfovibrio salsuginis TaxID=561720 RepID=A0A1X7KCK9_9BACT|nr:cobalamin biosynthesis protein [Dethiosulfovibrio salsuginis]SMG38952.1 cobalt-precorrin 5A hydrolase / precorrin-3B C17-methyltransferase [Dethiosulfovibrio salsuginis]
MISVFSVSQRGAKTGERCASLVGGEHRRPPRDQLRSSVSQAWGQSKAIVMVGSIGVAVRVIAPLLQDKETDPAVIVVTEDGKTVIPLTGAHLGGGTDLSRSLGTGLEAEVVLTTSSDRTSSIAPDLLCSRWGWKIEGKRGLVDTNGALLDGKDLLYWIEEDQSMPPFPERYLRTPRRDLAQVIVSSKKRGLASDQVQLVPPSTVAGMGCRKGTAKTALLQELTEALEDHGLLIQSVGEIRTAWAKKDEPGLMALGEELGIPVTIMTDDEIKAVQGTFSPSAAEDHLGLPGVAEPCAASAGRLLGPRRAQNGVTVALAHRPLNFVGKLSVVGTGPGDSGYITLQAREAIDRADWVVGYRLYVDQLPQEWLEGKGVERYGMGQEEERVEAALSLARKGYRVALVSGGDPILFGMAGLARNMAMGVPLEVIPGLSAVQAAGATLGAPYSNGLIMLSLSDYLQPWRAIEVALEGAASTDLTVALYNPVRKGLEEKLDKVKYTFTARGYIDGWLIRDAGRPEESMRPIKLAELDHRDVDMRTMILLPGKNTVYRDGVLVDTRGYGKERTDSI